MYIVIKKHLSVNGNPEFRNGGSSRIHYTEEDAVAEAKRLAGNECGNFSYVVFKAWAEAARATAPVEVTHLK